MMDKSPATIQLPASLYAELQALAADEQIDPVEVIRRLVAIANQRHAWRRDLMALRDQIREEGGLQIGTSKEEVVERLRQTRREIFEAEYAHLYR
jgi:hypothetical protein